MAVDNISGVRNYTTTPTGGVVETVSSSDNKGTSQMDFLKLMTTQLQFQDPFNPTDGQEMIVQMAQISNSTGIAEMNETLKSIQTQIEEQTAVLQTLKTATGSAAGTGTSDGSTDTTTAS